MSGPQGVPPDPDGILRRLEDMVRDAANAPDMLSSAIETIAGIHAKWYFAWQAHGVPEQRAAEWAGLAIAASFRQGD